MSVWSISARRGPFVTTLLTLNPLGSNRQPNLERPSSIERQAGSNRQISIHRQTCSDRQNSMLVKPQSKGREVLGLDVGALNARRYFSKDASVINLELDHLQISCDLAPDFWEGQAQIRDRRLCAWLELKNFHGKAGQSPAPLMMIPSGKNSFRLKPLSLRGPVRIDPDPQATHAHKPLTAA